MDNHGATRFEHLSPGDHVDQGDQLSSVILLGLALGGSAVALILNALL